MADALVEQEKGTAGTATAEQKLWELYKAMTPVDMVTALIKGGNLDQDLEVVIQANFELGKTFYHESKQANLLHQTRVGIIQSGDFKGEIARIKQNGYPVQQLTGNSEDYLSTIRGFRIVAEMKLWELNIRRIRLSPTDRAGTSDQDAEQVRILHRKMNSAAAQLNGAAQAALEDGDVRVALLLCEAAGGFLTEGQTVMGISGTLSRKDDTLEKVVLFVQKRDADPLVIATFQDTMGAIEARRTKEQRKITGFENIILPKLGKPGDVMYRP